jgi:serine phosphatase RsbU (regulator of sigma subunit)/anti-sigma regulatory factor (Ser/Thr protein kinase)
MTDASAQFSRSVALKLRLPCDLSEVRPAALRVSEFLKEQGLSSDEVSACELALVEACNNAVQYASAPGQKENIAVDVICDAAAVEFHIRDHTAGFDWPAQLNLPDPEQERGRGLFLIQSLMDEARYFRGNGANSLVLHKNRAPAVRDRPLALQAAFEQLAHQVKESEQIISDMAEELSFCYESLSAIFRCSAELGRTHNLKEFSQRLLNDLAQITSADWFILRLLSRDGTKLNLFTASDARFKLPPLILEGERGPHSLEVQAALGRQDVWFEGDALPVPEDPLSAVQGGSTGLIHPFALGEQLIGTVAIGKTAGHTQFTAVHANVVHTFADFLGIQIANARFQEDQVHARVMSRELEIAKNIQRSLLPKALPQAPGYGLAGFCESAQQVGGDFYDVLKLDHESLVLIIADVMGKGIPAAMFAAILRSLVRAVPEWTNQPAHLLSRVNRLLFPELSGVDMFITAQLVFVNTSERRLVAASAGHCPMLLASQRNRSVKVLSPEGLPLGILPDTTFGAQVEDLAADSRLLLYTDGLTEARNAEGEFFGQERLVTWFERSLQIPRSAEELKSELAAELNQFQGSTTIQDDQTFLIMA